MNTDQVGSCHAPSSKNFRLAHRLAIFLGRSPASSSLSGFKQGKERRDAKLQLFLVLMSERKNPFVSREVTKALNQIDVVWAGESRVKTLWHKYYSLLSQQPGEERVHTWLELLAAMADDLHYKGLSQVDLDKFYVLKVT